MEDQSTIKLQTDLRNIESIDSLKKIGLEFDLSNEKMDECLKDDQLQDKILFERIEAQKKYKIESTPTIILNEKKYTNKIDYKSFKKAIDKNL